MTGHTHESGIPIHLQFDIVDRILIIRGQSEKERSEVSRRPGNGGREPVALKGQNNTGQQWVRTLFCPFRAWNPRYTGSQGGANARSTRIGSALR